MFRCSRKRFFGAWDTTANSMSRKCRFPTILQCSVKATRLLSVYYNVESGIKKPQDFKGKRVGTPEYAMTAGVWIRGFFADEYSVRPQDMKWFLGGQVEPGRKERIKLDL